MKKKSKSESRMLHSCHFIIVSCMDFRLQNHFQKWAKKNLENGGFDRVAIAGGVKNLPFVLDQIELSVKLHHTREAYLINHEDCGGYSKEGSFKKHKEDLLFARKILQQKFPKLKINLLYQKLNGKFIKIS